MLKMFRAHNIIVRRSARSALFQFLNSAKKLLDKTEVLIPSFCCPSIYLSTLYAKCSPVFVDVDFNNFSICNKDLSKKISKNTLAVIYPHMFGINAIDKSNPQSKFKSAFPDVIWIEDACQSFLNQNLSGRRIGTQMDVGLFSFDKAKPIKIGRAGIISQFSKKPILKSIFKHIEDNSNYFIQNEHFQELERLESSFYSALISYYRVGGLNFFNSNVHDKLIELYLDCSTPDLDINKTFEIIKKINSVSKNKNNKPFYKLQKEFFKIKKNFFTIYNIKSDDMIWRYPLVFNDIQVAKNISNELRKRGIECSNHYFSLSSIFENQISTCPNSNYLSNRIINIWFKSSAEVNVCINFFKKYFK